MFGRIAIKYDVFITKLYPLMKQLFADGRTEDAMLAVEDESTRKKLYKEYGIITK